MENIKNELSQQGVSCFPKILSNSECNRLSKIIKARIQEWIDFHACSESIYYTAVNRWPLSAFIDKAWQEAIIKHIAAYVNQITNLELTAFEADILYKSPYANLPTPCHQDMPYAIKKPYLFSTWLALTKVTSLSSPLQFLPGSHHAVLEPAIDFWQPDFVDGMRQSAVWQQHAVTMPIGAGDTLIFSAKIWHSSLSYQTEGERWALAIRWGNQKLATPTIPLPPKNNFGMWNCGKYTQALLQKGLANIFNLKVVNYLEAIKIWQILLQAGKISFVPNLQACYLALEKLRILDEAYQKYNAGDGQGIVYVEVWRELLCPLNAYLKNTSPKLSHPELV